MAKRYNLSQLTDAFATQTGMSKTDSERFIKSFFDMISEGLMVNGRVKIKGLGTFRVVQVKDRESVRVNTGERFVIPGYRKVAFTPDNNLKESINKPFSAFETVVLTDTQAGLLETVDEPESKAAKRPTDAAKVTESSSGQKRESASEPVSAQEPVTEKVSKQESKPKSKSKSKPKSKSEKARKTGEKISAKVGEPQVKEITRKRGTRLILKFLLWILAILLVLLVLTYLFWPLLGQKFFKQFDIESRRKTDRIETVIDQDAGDVTMQPGAESMEPAGVEPTEEVVQPEQIRSSSTPSAVFRLNVADQNKDLADFTAADTVNYRMTGTMSTHYVKSGETLTRIALNYYGTKKLWPYIAAYNKMSNYNALKIGRKLLIPVLEAK
ncbi:MAG TPA: HU family DNA-binding protein [Bacteroidaceae bacterium]|jgi:nucleoid DNA-binding protein/nucleoid-associated protein YgaU|nr:HU family DNA-binding protein [Bacteroidaceae bacterium]OPZ47893.1 MAG: DNA-binding protein HU [Bacteroidetes bacterium ADurb.BinA104]HOD69015.1 HU family DNA-binding protein [Bacteroidaceae bacterium]HQL26531.1 HU family DNA-binding protein [Bacteroidaceae bacterium]